MATSFTRLRRALGQPVDAASLVAFRVGFGMLATLAAVRFVAMGWVEELLLAPTFHFAWIDGVAVPSPPVLYTLFAVQAAAGVGIAFRWWPRVCLSLWLISFLYVELLDKTLYLNHYVLFTLLGITLLLSPIHQMGLNNGSTAPTWLLWMLRLQVGSVFVWAGIAKLNGDWLWRAEPLKSWLQARADIPIVGWLLAQDTTAVAMSWGGLGYDLAIPFLLLHPRTRALGVALVAFFHIAVGMLFPIGVFPLLMMLGATVLLSPSWPRRWIGERLPMPQAQLMSRFGCVTWVVAALLLLLIPGRGIALGQPLSWTEENTRFSWRVLVTEKTGMVDFLVVDPHSGRRWSVQPADELTPLQHKQMRTRPDMIRDYAHHLRRRFGGEVEVYAESWASLNGRPSQRLLREDLDLTLPLSALKASHWLVPLRGSESRTPKIDRR